MTRVFSSRDSGESPMDIKSRIDAAPMTRPQIMIIGICVTLNMLDGFDVLALAFSASAISAEWGLSGAQLGVLLSAALLGMAAGSIFVSQIADVIGRRRTILICAVVITIGMGLSAAATGYTMLLLVRIITGLAIGTLQACLNVFVAEYSSAKRRPVAISFYTAGQPIGGALGGIVAAVLLANFGWRSVFLFGAAATAVMIFIVLRFLPESIDYLVTRRPPGALEKLNAILTRLGHAVVAELPTVGPRSSVSGRWKDILSGATGIKTLLLGTAFFMLMAGFYFANSWTPKLVAASGFSPSDGVQAGVMFSAGGIAGALLFGPLAARFGVRPMLITTFVLTSGAFAAYALSMGSLGTAFAAAALLGLLTSAAMSGMFSLGPAYYSPEVRATGVGFIIGVGRVGAIISPIVVGTLLDGGWAPHNLYYLFLVPMLLAAGSVIALRNSASTTTASKHEVAAPSH